MAIKTFFTSTGSWVKRAAFVALSGTMSALLVSCGGGGAASTTPVPTPTPPVITLAVLPTAADVFPGFSVDFTVTGGTAPYTTGSSNSVVLPAPPVTGSASAGYKFAVLANSVIGDTSVTITVRDSVGATTPLILNVRAATLNNTVTITPVAPTGTGCNGLCSGGDAQVDVTAQLNGIKLINRAIRFDVFQGDFRFVDPVTSALVTSLIKNTDENGVARVRMRALVTAPTQVAILTSTDTVTGLVRSTNFVIQQVTSGVGILSVLPSGSVTFTGAKPAAGLPAQCPFGGIVDHYIYGGTPPYQIVSPLPQYLSVFPSTVTTNGGSYRVTQSGCGTGTVLVTDAQNRVVESPTVVGVAGPAGDAAASPTPTSLAVNPLAFGTATNNAIGCGQTGTSTTTGSGTYTATITTPGVPAGAFSILPSSGTVGSSISFVRNQPTTPIVAPVPSVISVNVVVGTTTQTVTITLPVDPTTGTTNCPAGP